MKLVFARIAIAAPLLGCSAQPSKEALRFAAPTLSSKRAERLLAFAHQTDGGFRSAPIYSLRVALASEPDPEVRAAVLEAAGKPDESPDDESWLALGGDRLRWEPASALRDLARLRACGSAEPLEVQIAHCRSASECERLSRCLGVAGARALDLVEPWSRRAEPEWRRLAANVVCRQAVHENGVVMQFGDTVFGPWLGLALAILARDPDPADPESRTACLDAIATDAKLPREALLSRKCEER